VIVSFFAIKNGRKDRRFNADSRGNERTLEKSFHWTTHVYDWKFRAMVATNSTMLPLGTEAPAFQLPDMSGKTVALDQFKGASALLVVFMCNHCPYVKHIRSGLAQAARDYQARGVAVVGINSNDVANYPPMLRQNG